MVMRRILLLLSAGMLVAGCLSLYMMLELQIPMSLPVLVPPEVPVAPPLRNNELNNIEVKIKQIEEDLQRNHKTINDIKYALGQIVKGDDNAFMVLKTIFERIGGSVVVGGGEPKKPKPAAEKQATRFVMSSDRSGGSSLRQSASSNLSKPCLLSRAQSKVGLIFWMGSARGETVKVVGVW